MFGIFNKAKRDKDRFNAGWNFAAGQLLTGKSVDEVYAWAGYGIDFDGANQFDAGMIAACRAWQNRDHVLVNVVK